MAVATSRQVQPALQLIRAVGLGSPVTPHKRLCMPPLQIGVERRPLLPALFVEGQLGQLTFVEGQLGQLLIHEEGREQGAPYPT